MTARALVPETRPARYRLEVSYPDRFVTVGHCDTQPQVLAWCLEHQLPLVDVYRNVTNIRSGHYEAHLVFTVRYHNGKVLRSDV